MVLVGLLLLALLFVVVGIVRGSVGWLIASLVVSVLAAAVLLRSYLQTRTRAVTQPAAPEPATAAAEPVRPPAAAELGPTAVPGDPQVWVVDGHPEYHVQRCAELAGRPAEAVPYEQAVEDGFQPCVVCNPDRDMRPAAVATPGATLPAPPDSRQVLVIDGLPQYHAAGCRVLRGHESVSIPVEQAVEDGFAPCALCEPHPEAAGAGASTDVWVVDGYPDYHRASCPTLVGLAAEAVPHDQAVEDGFAECAVCTPESDVWVVDGFPNYHRADCAELSGLPAEAIPHHQAVEDGFAPCPVCEEAERQVWVVDGHPDYHRTGCERLTGLPAEPIPYQQAVEDGFASCPVCRPDEETEAAEEPEATDDR